MTSLWFNSDLKFDQSSLCLKAPIRKWNYDGNISCIRSIDLLEKKIFFFSNLLTIMKIKMNFLLNTWRNECNRITEYLNPINGKKMFQNCNYSEPYINPSIVFYIKIDSLKWKLPTPRTRLDGRFERVFRLLTDSRCGFNATTNESALKHSLNAQYCYANRTAYVMIFRRWALCKQIEKNFWFRCSF